jgi:hypothetical protein
MRALVGALVRRALVGGSHGGSPGGSPGGSQRLSSTRPAERCRFAPFTPAGSFCCFAAAAAFSFPLLLLPSWWLLMASTGASSHVDCRYKRLERVVALASHYEAMNAGRAHAHAWCQKPPRPHPPARPQRHCGMSLLSAGSWVGCHDHTSRLLDV